MNQEQNIAPSEPLLRVQALSKQFAVSVGRFGGTRPLHALDNVSFSINAGECLGLVGESGCGKSTLGRTILQLLTPTSGAVFFKGQDLSTGDKKTIRTLRRDVQVVFQDPYSSLNPRMRVRDIIAEPLMNQKLPRREIDERVQQVIQDVGLRADYLGRYPHAFSGGQRQRIGIARALVQRPKLLICDEAVSALDVSVQAQILNLLQEIREEYELTILFISHNLSVVRHIADRVAVMYLGQVVEIGGNEQIFTDPQHPYTRSLISAVLEPTRNSKSKRIMLGGEIPSPLDPPPGCYFSTRCPIANERCRTEQPAFIETEDQGGVRCHTPGEFKVDMKTATAE
jgi:oligopeptide/dipeptide ABC transporter ATP-binding protein